MAALSNVQIRKLARSNSVAVKDRNGNSLLTPDTIQPASIDIGPISGELRFTHVYSNRIDGNYISKYTSLRNDFSSGFVFEPGATYLITGPHIELPQGVDAHVEQKSTVGRLGLYNELLLPQTRNGVNKANYIPPGYSGPTYFRIQSRAFPIELQSGDTIAQLRLSKAGTGFIPGETLNMLYGDENWFCHYKPFKTTGVPVEKIPEMERAALIPKEDVISKGAINIHASTRFILQQKPKHEISPEPIVYSKSGKNAVAEITDYWDVILNNTNELLVPQGDLILISTSEIVGVGPRACAKMGIKTEGFGIHMETHRAGFVDPGFKAHITAEIVNHGNPFRLIHGDYLSHLLYENMDVAPDVMYGANNNYQGQPGPVPPKQFKGFKSIWDDARDGKLKPKVVGGTKEEFFDALEKALV